MIYTKKLYEITVTVWEGGTGRTEFQAVAKGLTNAVVVKEALEKVFPDGLESESGDEIIKRNIKVEIHPLFKHEIRELIEAGEFE